MNILGHVVQMRNPRSSNTNLITLIINPKQEKIKVRKRVAPNLYMEKNPNALSTLFLKKKRDLLYK